MPTIVSGWSPSVANAAGTVSPTVQSVVLGRRPRRRGPCRRRAPRGSRRDLERRNLVDRRRIDAGHEAAVVAVDLGTRPAGTPTTAPTLGEPRPARPRSWAERRERGGGQREVRLQGGLERRVERRLERRGEDRDHRDQAEPDHQRRRGRGRPPRVPHRVLPPELARDPPRGAARRSQPASGRATSGDSTATPMNVTAAPSPTSAAAFEGVAEQAVQERGDTGPSTTSPTTARRRSDRRSPAVRSRAAPRSAPPGPPGAPADRRRRP